jgi:hypothetical protein
MQAKAPGMSIRVGVALAPLRGIRLTLSNCCSSASRLVQAPGALRRNATKRTSIPGQVLDIIPVTNPPASASAAAPAASFNTDLDDVLIDIKCKDCDGSGLFKYSSRKIQWLKDRFKENYHEPNRFEKHKAIADAERGASSPDSSPDNAIPPHAVPISPLPKVGSRFGSRRTPFGPDP